MSGQQPPPALYIVRTHAHSGSEWLAAMVASANVSTYFQFDGRCHGGHEMANQTQLERLLDTGCNCLFAHVTPSNYNAPTGGNAHNLHKTHKNAFCTNACNGSAVDGCRGVAVLPSIHGSDGLLVDTIEGLARKRARVKYVSFLRTNAVKHAISILKSACSLNYIHNHNSEDEAAPSGLSVLHFEPQLVLERALRMTAARSKQEWLNEYAETQGLETFHVHYENMQRNASAVMGRLLGWAGMGGDIGAHFPAKMAPDDLSQLLLNYHQVDALFESAPCHRQMLGARGPQLLEPCRANETEGLRRGKRWNKVRESAAAHTLRSVTMYEGGEERGEAGGGEEEEAYLDHLLDEGYEEEWLRSMQARFTTCACEVGARDESASCALLCESAREMARRLGKDPAKVEVCELK